MVELNKEFMVTSLSAAILFIYILLETGNFFIAIFIPLLLPLILKLRRIFLVYLLPVSFSAVLILHPFILNLERILYFFLLGVIPFVIIMEASMSYCNLKRIDISLKGAFSTLLPLFFILPFFILGWRNFAFTSAEVITSVGIFYLFLISSMILFLIICSESRYNNQNNENRR